MPLPEAERKGKDRSIGGRRLTPSGVIAASARRSACGTGVTSEDYEYNVLSDYLNGDFRLA